ncbi:MAG: hypothetical protein ACRDHZ_12340, partial [Ktedonobacteraceae bacterium]
TWKTQVIATVMRAKPACLIPVLAEPMELPDGPWTHKAVNIGGELETTTQELVQILRNYLATRPTPIQHPNSATLTVGTPLKFKKHRRPIKVRPLFSTLLILLIVGLGAVLSYRYTAHPATGQGVNPNLSIPTTVTHLAYSAKAPGQGCDTGDGQWNVSAKYKKDKNTEVIDKYTALQCQPDGALLTRSGDYATYSELFFNGPSSSTTLTPHYLVQVDATVTSGDAHTQFVMDTHIHDNGYGRYSFNVNTLGHWEATTNSTDGVSFLNRLAIGFFPKASKTYTLALETNGPIMIFWINNTKVTTVTDTTYTDNNAIAFGVDDYSATQPISALFSNFQYTELAPSTLTTPQMVATATAQAQTTMQTAYTAHIPGYGCDQGAGQWQPLADDNSSGTLNCLPNGMQLTNPADASQIATENFYGFNGQFPQNYQISAQIDVSTARDGCAGLKTHADANDPKAYFFVICPDGSWVVAVYTDKFQTLDQGTVGAHGSYQIQIIDQGSTQSLSINGSKVSTINNTQVQGTDHISLLTGYYKTSGATSATFSNFVFTPLP